jgi:Zn-dependent metalloprotease
MFQYIDYFGSGTSIHEGLADIIGIYVENKIQQRKGQAADFILGDDDPIVKNGLNRDLANPKFTCYDDVKDLKFIDRHDRGPR